MLRAKDAGQPCTKCRHFIPEDMSGTKPQDRKYCGHLAYSQQSFDPVSGAVTAKIDVLAQKARASDGLCGPEGALFERGYFNVPTFKESAIGLWRHIVFFFALLGVVGFADVLSRFWAG